MYSQFVWFFITPLYSLRKYKDATLLNEFHEMEMSHDVNSHRAMIDDNGAAASSAVVNSHQQAEDSSDEEEVDTGNYRP